MEIIRLYSPTFYDVSRAAQQWKLKNCKQSVISFWLQVLCSGITEGGGADGAVSPGCSRHGDAKRPHSTKNILWLMTTKVSLIYSFLNETK